MGEKEKYKRLIKFGSSAVILAEEIGLFAIIWTYHYNTLIEAPFWRRGNWLMVALYGLLLAFFLYTYGGLKIGYLTKGNLIYSQMLSIIITNIIAYMQLALIDKKFHNPYMFLVLTAADLVVIIIWVYIFQWLYEKIFPPRTLIVVYGERPVFHILEKINSRDDKYIISGAINLDKGIDKIMTEIPKYEGVIIGDIPAHERNMILKSCYNLGIRSYVAPKLSDILVRGSSELNLFDTPLLLSRNTGLQADQSFLKRIEDIVLSLAMFIASSWIFILVALAIKIEDRGPVFYKQKRLTKNGQVFDILKFRTMKVDAEKDGVARLSSGDADPRITMVGKLLRATRLDELPQLLNILHGEMSLVGPRPERPEIAEEYEKEIPEFNFRLKVKAGLTGYAQVYGKYNTTPYDKLKLDMTYITNYSMWLDLKLILMTPKVLFMKEATEGIADGATTASLTGEIPEITPLEVEKAKRKKLKEEVYGKRIELETEIKKKRKR